MKNRLLFLGIVLVAVLGLTLVLAAEDNKGRQIAAFDDVNSANPVLNQTYGQCVSQAAKIRNNCTDYEHIRYLGCLDAAKVIEKSNDKMQGARQCQASYRITKSDCKTMFKTTKTECKKIKHGFFEGMRYWFA